MDKKNRVYMVWYDNNEPYEDNLAYPIRIFKTWEEAEKYIEENFSGFTKKSMQEHLELLPHGADYCKVRRPEWNEYDDLNRGTYCIRIWDLQYGEELMYDNEHIFLVEERRSHS